MGLFLTGADADVGRKGLTSLAYLKVFCHVLPHRAYSSMSLWPVFVHWCTVMLKPNPPFPQSWEIIQNFLVC